MADLRRDLQPLRKKGSGSVWFAMLRGLCESLAAFAVNRFLAAKIAKNRR
jgi:hypothetical protein